MILNALDREESPADAWTGLNHFLERLHGAGKSANPFSLLLEAVAESVTAADAVFLCGPVPDSPTMPAGRIRLDERWCQDFARTVLSGRERPIRHGVVSQLPPVGSGDRQPTTTAMVQLS